MAIAEHYEAMREVMGAEATVGDLFQAGNKLRDLKEE